MFSMKQQKTYNIDVIWDNEAAVFVAHSDDVPGLNTEAPTLPELVERVTDIVPILLSENETSELGGGYLFNHQPFLVPFQEQVCG